MVLIKYNMKNELGSSDLKKQKPVNRRKLATLSSLHDLLKPMHIKILGTIANFMPTLNGLF